MIGHAGTDALKGLEREIKDGYSGEGITEDADIPAEVKEMIDHAKHDVKAEYEKVVNAGKAKGIQVKSKLEKAIDEANSKHEKDVKSEEDGEWKGESRTESTTTESRNTVTRTESSSSRTENSSSKRDSKAESDPSDSTVLVDSHCEDTKAYEANIDDVKTEEEIQEEDKTT